MPGNTTSMPGRCARRLAVLALCGALLGCGHGGGLPDTVDLPAWNPEPGDDGDAFIYLANDAVVGAVDGTKVKIGYKYWYAFLRSPTPKPFGPHPWNTHEANRNWTYIIEDFKYDSMLLRPGRHSLKFGRMYFNIDRKTGSDDIFYSRGSITAPLTVERNAVYKVLIKEARPITGKYWWVVVVKLPCSRKTGEKIRIALISRCLSNNSLIVASSFPGEAGKQYNDVYGPNPKWLAKHPQDGGATVFDPD